MDNRDKDHILALKVMRLTKPTFSSPTIVTCENKDLPNNLLNNNLKYDITSVPGLETLTSGQFLLLPQSFGNLYLGETFSSYVCVHNDSSHVARNVTLKADLQTALNRISLTNTESSSQVVDVAPGNTIDKVINHEVTERGTHVLICEVNYVNQLGQTTSFRKFFKFNVAEPLEIKTKFYNSESDEVFLEAEIKNITTGPINLERVTLESSDMFTVKPLQSPEEGKIGGLLLHSRESRQYLYRLAPARNAGSLEHSGATNIGKVDMMWRTNLGEKGRLQTSQLQRTAPEYGDIRLSVEQIPNIVQLEKPFTFMCKVMNVSKRQMDLTLSLEKSQSGLAWIGVSGKQIGPLEPGSSTHIELTMVPLSAGLHYISGIKLTDVFLKRTSDYDDLAQVFVT